MGICCLKLLQSTNKRSNLQLVKLENSKKKMDLGWGGVPRQQPSDTALKYLNEFHKVLKEKDLPSGSHLRSTRIMEDELRGFKQCRKDLSESYENFYKTVKRLQRSEKPATEVKNIRKPMTFRVKPGSGIGRTEPRKEYFIGLVDIRLSLKGYIGGVKKRESQCA